MRDTLSPRCYLCLPCKSDQKCFQFFWENRVFLERYIAVDHGSSEHQRREWLSSHPPASCTLASLAVYGTQTLSSPPTDMECLDLTLQRHAFHRNSRKGSKHNVVRLFFLSQNPAPSPQVAFQTEASLRQYTKGGKVHML